jgi:GntR family transcriptional repressor for pyruvate dehydrogenase complex
VSGTLGVPPKAARLAADRLKERILTGEYVPGDFLPTIDDLLIEFGISRPTMREALNLLEAGGLVRLRRGPGGGTVVRVPDNDEVVRALDALFRYERTTVAHLMEVRLVLEPAAARLAALRGTDEEFAELAQSIERQKSADLLQNDKRWFEENLAFHNKIGHMARNPVVRVLTDSLRELIRQAGSDASYTIGDRRRSIRYHVEIYKRLIARDAKGAEAAHRRHLNNSIYVRKHIVQPVDWGDALLREDTVDDDG